MISARHAYKLSLNGKTISKLPCELKENPEYFYYSSSGVNWVREHVSNIDNFFRTNGDSVLDSIEYCFSLDGKTPLSLPYKLDTKQPTFFFYSKGKGKPFKRRLFKKIRHYFTYTEENFNKTLHQTGMNIHKNQFLASKEVTEMFEHGLNHVILTAEMQSGKTGAVRSIVHRMLHLTQPYPSWEDRFVAEKVFFVCGMNDNDLRAQTVREFHGFLPEENIMFSKQLQQWNMCAGYEEQRECSLVIIDESHYAGKVDSQVDLFLKNIEYWNPFVVSVSATAMAELATSLEMGKGVVHLIPGEGYYGIRNMLSRGLIFQSKSLNTYEDKMNFMDLMINEYDMQYRNGQKKYNVVRLNCSRHFEDLEEIIKNEMSETGDKIDFINYHSEDHTLKDFNDIVSTPPENFTIIWIYNSLRAGKQVNTEHIGFVHDTMSSRVDTSSQSLPGRICGYNKEAHNVRVYTDMTSICKFRDWIQSRYSIMMIPAGGSHVVNGFHEGQNWDTHVPIFVPLYNSCGKNHRCSMHSCEVRFLYTQTFHRHSCKENVIELIKKMRSDDDDVQRILNDYKPGKCGGVMVLSEYNSLSSIRSNWDMVLRRYQQNRPCGKSFSVCQPGNYYYIYVNMLQSSPYFGTALIVYKEFLKSGQGISNIGVCEKSRFFIRNDD